MNQPPAYGLWSLVIINSLVFIIFAFSFTKPKSPRDWRSFGAFSAFIVALFTEMYGFPLTIYLLSGWLQSRYPELDLLSHEAGHLWHTLLGWEGNPHLDPLHILSNVLIFAGFILLASAWKVLYEAQRRHTLALTGPYARVRHPQYDAFILIMLGFLLQWPTILTLLMFPVLVWVYTRLAFQEEREIRAEFGEKYARYAATTPAFFPGFGGTAKRKI
ncbi:isoprenylcysteine carboxyl methyltransferase [Moorena producens PAL-8-15-08-1]|uniref:Isoprenylcysteine carboxyl methyltransferase n=1 Tax=Moorena producens PAL-8-15-08-1 TaxID=1458985 RepID=A0A1D8TL45_9CYAN|nr:isoprenylcysteine carboxylmethyltransferase family protein [Moorena producens]AOW98334.1 isoprenylcysteine carboxyl methyltransferase [Moorena producens PAL-8-15-08-1]